MATVDAFGAGSNASNALQQAFVLADIQPGDDPSYEACKAVMLYHPLGFKMTETPVRLAQSLPRIISVPCGPEERLVEEFERHWKRLKINRLIRNAMKLARCYGISTIAIGTVGEDTAEPLDLDTLYKQEVYFNVFDPLNTSGSLVLNQDPNAPDFLKKRTPIRVNGYTYHPSRTLVLMNEDPTYIAYSVSAFGFVGRSVFQRAWYPLKSFIGTMQTDDLISRKAGVLIAKMKAPGSIVSQAMQSLYGMKRQMLQQAQTDNVLGITVEESVESLNLQNIDGAGKFARDNVLKNIAVAADMPAVLLDQETFARGMAEGSEDMKAVAQYIDTVRDDMGPLYDFCDDVVQRVAWNPDFYAAIQSDFPEYRGVPYERALADWQRNFSATWPSFLREEPSELVQIEDVKQKAVVALLEVLMSQVGPNNRATLITWAQDNINSNKEMFSSELQLDPDEIAEFEPQPLSVGMPQPMGGKT